MVAGDASNALARLGRGEKKHIEIRNEQEAGKYDAKALSSFWFIVDGCTCFPRMVKENLRVGLTF